MSTSSSETPLIGFAHYFEGLPDPRFRRARRHSLLTILFTVLCGMLSGADNPTEIARWARAKRSWLADRIELDGAKDDIRAIPSAQTLRRFLAHLDPDAFATCFQAWTKALYRKTEGEIIALDGKTVRHSFDEALGQKALHVVSVWAAANRMVLSQRKVEDHENEIVAIPDLLHLLDIRGCIVTIDAMGCQKEIAKQIVEKKADFVLALKENHPHLHDSAQEYFTYWRSQDWKTEQDSEPVAHQYAQTFGKGHGRIERRRCWVVENAQWLDPDNEWTGFQSVVAIEGERQQGGKASFETRYFLTSLKGEKAAHEALRAVRAHWGIENRLHWVLDMVFREDQSRVRRGHAQQNLTILRKIALQMIRQEKSQKIGLQMKRRLAGWDIRYLETILTGKSYEPDER